MLSTFSKVYVFSLRNLIVKKGWLEMEKMLKVSLSITNAESLLNGERTFCLSRSLVLPFLWWAIIQLVLVLKD